MENLIIPISKFKINLKKQNYIKIKLWKDKTFKFKKFIIYNTNLNKILNIKSFHFNYPLNLKKFTLNTFTNKDNLLTYYYFKKLKTLNNQKQSIKFNNIMSYEIISQNSYSNLINLNLQKNPLLITEIKQFKLLMLNPINLKTDIWNKLNTWFLINSGNFNNILHKYILDYNKYPIISKYQIISNYPKQKQLFIKLEKFYLNKNLFSFIKINSLPKPTGLLKNLFSSIETTKQTKDIIYGLQYIDTIFETKFKNPISLISKKGYLIDKISYQIFNKLNLIYINKILIFHNKTYDLCIGFSTKIKPLFIQTSSIVSGGDVFQINEYSPQIILTNKFLNLYFKLNQYKAWKISFKYIQQIIIESLFKQYLNNNIKLPIFHFELISKKMTSCVKIISIGDTSFQYNELLPLNLVHFVNKAISIHGYQIWSYHPIVLGISRSVLAYSGFFSAASFQKTFNILIKSALETKLDWIIDLKTRIMFSDLITTGSGWYRFFNNL
uniref:DNA-directed RNA polymerase n=1 Tax=Nephromyces sp. ex Molgula occidentalis TaxID=2544991 RepID=A0A5C1H8D4_9APIC|nr:plastid-encoded DNA-directed RNA polymerase beta''B [Nephromyces sp. ex Molgula occidentalis]